MLAALWHWCRISSTAILKAAVCSVVASDCKDVPIILSTTYLSLFQKKKYDKKYRDQHREVCLMGSFPQTRALTQSWERTAGVWTNHGNYNNQRGILCVCVCLWLCVCFSKQTSSISVYRTRAEGTVQISVNHLLLAPVLLLLWFLSRNKRATFHLFSRALNHRPSSERLDSDLTSKIWQNIAWKNVLRNAAF